MMTYQTAQPFKKHYKMAGAMAFLAALMANGSAIAGPKIFSDGTTLDFRAAVETTAKKVVDPFMIEVFSAGNECLQIFVAEQNADLEATLVAPDGATWRDDDSGGSNRPLINAVTTVRGWHILRLSQFSGAPVNALGRLFITRLPTSSCNPVTVPITIFSRTTRKAAQVFHPLPNGPSSR